MVVVFDKVQENTRGITASNTQTYGEAANLAVNQTLMRSINTSVVALLPVGGLLFIGAGLLGAGTLKDLGLVLFVGMARRRSTRRSSSPPRCWWSSRSGEPRFRPHTQRVLARRAASGGQRESGKAAKARAATSDDRRRRAPVAGRLEPAAGRSCAGARRRRSAPGPAAQAAPRAGRQAPGDGGRRVRRSSD